MYTLHSFNFFKSISNIIMHLGKATLPPISQIPIRPLAHPPTAATLSPVAMPTLLQATELRTTDLLLTPQSMATQQQSKTKVATPKPDGGYSSSNVSAVGSTVGSDAVQMQIPVSQHQLLGSLLSQSTQVSLGGGMSLQCS